VRTKISYFFSRQHCECSNIIHMARAFCRVQSCPPDDSTVYVLIVMRSDASMSPDGESHAKMCEDCSWSEADINL
jgi:hypothetical protein